MKEADTEQESAFPLSTYSIVTAERILERYQIQMPQADIIEVLKRTNSFYHRLLKVPLQQVFNGIILQQTHDYQVYAQKLFIDYLMSGERDKSADLPGAGIRETLEQERQALTQMLEDFHNCELEHFDLIADSQKRQIYYAKVWQETLAKSYQILKSQFSSSIEENLFKHTFLTMLSSLEMGESPKSKISANDWREAEKALGLSFTAEQQELWLGEMVKFLEFLAKYNAESQTTLEKVNGQRQRFRQWRTDYYQFILKIKELLNLLPEYRFDPQQSEENRESLYFDADLGGKG